MVRKKIEISEPVVDITKDFTKKQRKLFPWGKAWFFGAQYLKRAQKDGFIVGELVLPGGGTQYLLIDLKTSTFEKTVSGDRKKIFHVVPIREHPDKYVRRVDKFYVASFDWRSGKPIPNDVTHAHKFDDEYFADLIMRAGLNAQTLSAMQLIENVKKIFGLIQMAAVFSGLNLLYHALTWFGVLK